MSAIEYQNHSVEQKIEHIDMEQNIENIEQQQNIEQNIRINEFHNSINSIDNALFIPTSQLTESPLEDPYLFEGEDCINQEFYYYYYNNQFTPEEQLMLGVSYNEDNNQIYLNDQVNSILTWSPEIELQNHMNEFPYLYNDIIENDNFDTFNPFMVQSSVYNESESIPTTLGNNNLLLTQPLSEVTQNVIENQQFQSYNWCDLTTFTDAQHFIIDNNISAKIAEQNNNNNNNNNNNITTENHYTPWTDFQLLEA